LIELMMFIIVMSHTGEDLAWHCLAEHSTLKTAAGGGAHRSVCIFMEENSPGAKSSLFKYTLLMSSNEHSFPWQQ
jgi:hypothetical protein